MSPYRSTALPGHSLFLTRSVRLGMAAPLLWLLGCTTSVPLPAWTPGLAQPAAATATTLAPSPPARPALEQTLPAVPAATLTSLPLSPAAPYSAAVAARFPAPSVIYGTPGLQAGRAGFTTQAEIARWLREQADAVSRSAGAKAAVLPIGQSQQGQALEALVLTRGSGTDPAALRASGRPTVLLIGQQHGDEPAGSEALLVIARELAQGLLQPLLEQINVVIVVRANPDGAAMNQRATASGLDMNQDHLLLNTPEARALAKLTSDYQPTAVLDAHEYTVSGSYLEKFGTVQKFDALFHYATHGNLSEFLTKAAEEWYRRPLLAALKGQGLTSEWSYTASADPADRKVSMGSAQPDTSPTTDGLKNIVSLQIATRGADLGRTDIQRRVHTHVTAMTSVLGSTAQRAKELGQLRPYMDKDISAQACKGEAVVESAPTLAPYGLVMLEPLSGADKTVTVDWDSTLTLFTLKKRARPCGYWLGASSRTAAERLALQGLQVRRVLRQSVMLGDMYLETRRPSEVLQDARRNSANAPSPATEVALVHGVIDAPKGSYYIPLNQPLANLAIAALEPDTPSSYFSNQLIEGLASIARVMSEPSLQAEERP